MARSKKRDREPLKQNKNEMKTPFEQLAEAMSNQSLILEDIAKSYYEQTKYEESKLIHARASGWREAANMLFQNKSIEKEAIINAFISGDNSDCLQEQDSKLFAKQYYEQTFNTKENETKET